MIWLNMLYSFLDSIDFHWIFVLFPRVNSQNFLEQDFYKNDLTDTFMGRELVKVLKFFSKIGVSQQNRN